MSISSAYFLRQAELREAEEELQHYRFKAGQVSSYSKSRKQTAETKQKLEYLNQSIYINEPRNNSTGSN